MRLTALERTRDLPTPRLADLLFKTWVGAILLLPVRPHFGWEWLKTGWEKWFTRHRTPTTTPTPA